MVLPILAQKLPMENTLPISKSQLRIFIFSFLTIFIMVCLQYLGIRITTPSGGLLFPIPQETEAQNFGAMEEVSQKLESKQNTFTLYHEAQLVSSRYDTPQFDAEAYAVVDLDTGEIITEHNAYEALPIASLTKIMTAVVALDLAESTDIFTVSEHSAEIIPTEIGVQPGEKMSRDELLSGLLLVSANDAAEVLKEGIDAKYNEPVFMKAMNEKARFLGLSNTSFANPQGFDDPENYSTVADLAILTHYALNNYPLIEELAKKQTGSLAENENHSAYNFYNWNGLLGVYPDAYGLKIGNTGDAGKTTIVTAKRSDKTLAAIVLGAPDVVKRDLWAAALLDLGYEKTLNLEPVEIKAEQLYSKYSTWVY